VPKEEKYEDDIVKSSDDTLKSSLKKKIDLSKSKTTDAVVKETGASAPAVSKSKKPLPASRNNTLKDESRKVTYRPDAVDPSEGARSKVYSTDHPTDKKRATKPPDDKAPNRNDATAAEEGVPTKTNYAKQAGIVGGTAAYAAKELVSGGRPTQEDADNGTELAAQGRRTAIRGVGASYTAHKARKTAEETAWRDLNSTVSKGTSETYKARSTTGSVYERNINSRVRDSDEATAKTAEKVVSEAGQSARSDSLKGSALSEGIDVVRNIRATGDNLAEEGLVDIKDSVYRVKDTVKVAAATKKTAQTAVRAAKTNASRVARAVSRVGEGIKRVSVAVVKGTGRMMAAVVTGAPAILGIVAVLAVVILISSIVPTFTLKTEQEKLSELWVYCTDLDATFSKGVNNLLRSDGYDRIDFYMNGVKCEVNTLWTAETDLDVLLAYYDAIFEDYSDDSDDSSDSEDVEGVDGEAVEELDDDTDESTGLNPTFSQVKKYTKKLWKVILQVENYEHIEEEELEYNWIDENGELVEDVYIIKTEVLSVYVTQKSLAQLILQNAAADGAADVYYDSLLDVPFGYLTSSQKEAYDVLQEVGLYTAFEEVSNPFGETETSWRTIRRYGYYLFDLENEATKLYNSGIYIFATAGTAIFNGITGTVTEVADDAVTINTLSRTIRYSCLSDISVSVGDYIRAGTQIGVASGGFSVNGLPVIGVYYQLDDKEINPLFFIGGYARNNVGGVGNGDIVETALAEVGTLENYINDVKYNTWYYGREVNGAAYEWCCVFVMWCAEQNGFIDMGVMPKTAWCPYLVNFYSSQGLFFNRSTGYIPKAGDLIFFKYSEDDSGEPAELSNHVGIVVSCDGNIVYTVEGNTGPGNGTNPNGGGVWTKSYSMQYQYIYGFATPEYPASSSQQGEE